MSELDITAEACPMTLVRTRLALDRLAPGSLLMVRLSGTEPALEVPRAAEQLGHHIVSVTNEGAITLLLLRRA